VSARRHAPEPPPEPAFWPGLTVVVPAYREAGVIGEKVADVRANGYAGPLEVVVVAEDPETAFAARSAGATVVEPKERLGKAQAVNRGIEEADTDLVVLTDANNRLAPGSLALLARHLLDPRIGAVAGEKVEADAGGEELYWRFESWLKQREWALGTTIGIVGELVGLRRSVWQPIPDDISSDDLWVALDMNDRGHAVAYEPRALAVDPPYEERGHRWERRTRILAGSLFVFWSKRRLVSRRTPLLAFQIVGHKLWRSTVGPFSHVALLALAARHARHSRLAAAVVAGHAAGVAALVWQETGRPLPRPVTPVTQVLYLQGVALGGVGRFLRRDRVLRWSKVPR
jgi:cellulose synthase/poly-beta-1,6-N-acetylglucosamine synthase-like glycosyltransferase